MKTAAVILIFKSDNRYDIHQQLQAIISIPPTFHKIQEEIIAYPLCRYLGKKILTKNQHGFQKHRATKTGVLHFANNVYIFLEENICVVQVFIGLSKAIHSLNHSILLDKILKQFGIWGVNATAS